MQVQFLNVFSTISIQNKKLDNPISYATSKLNNLDKDVFVKSNNVSFKGIQNKDTNKVDIKDTIIGASAAGALFLIPLITAAAIAKHQNPDEIFLSDGTYLGKTSEMFVDKNKASELGFEIDPEKFKSPNCFCDEINGVFKDFKNGIDINLKEGKYVDLNKGVYVNPDDQTSVIFTGGDAVPVIIPSFGGASVINGGGVPVYEPNDPFSPENIVHKMSMDKYLSERNNASFSYQSKEEMNEYDGQFHRSFIIAERDKYLDHHQAQESQHSFYERVKDFFKEPQYQNEPKIDLYDIWGREIITLQDKIGQTHYVALTDELSDLMHKQHISYETAQAFLSYSAEHPIQNYIKENYADYLNNLHFENPSMENFLCDIKHNDAQYSEGLQHAHTDTTSNNTDHDLNEDYLHNQDSFDEPTNTSHWCNDDISGLV